MLPLPGRYVTLECETYHAAPSSGHRGGIRVRPVPGQEFSPDLNVECSKGFREAYPVGTKFLLRVKVTDREGGRPFLYSHHSWQPKLVSVS